MGHVRSPASLGLCSYKPHVVLSVPSLSEIAGRIPLIIFSRQNIFCFVCLQFQCFREMYEGSSSVEYLRDLIKEKDNIDKEEDYDVLKKLLTQDRI